MIQRAQASLMQFLRRSFLTGLLVLMPSVLTFGLCYTFFDWIDRLLILLLAGLPIEPIRGTGFVLGLMIVVAVGSFARNLVGARVLEFYEKLLHNLPIVNQLFPALRQVSSLIFTEHRTAFEKVVLIEYPRRGTYVIGFLAAATPQQIAVRTPHQTLLSIFIPTTPNPTSGFLLLVPEADVQVLDMTPEDGLKLIISGGLLAPEDRAPEAPAEVTVPAAPGDVEPLAPPRIAAG